MCQWPAGHRQYNFLGEAAASTPPHSCPGPPGTLFCIKCTFDRHSCLPLPKTWQVLPTSLGQTGKGAQKGWDVPRAPGGNRCSQTRSQSFREARDGTNYIQGAGTAHSQARAQTTRPSLGPPHQLSVSRFPVVLIHITYVQPVLLLGPSQAKQIPPETVLLSLASPPPNCAA